MCVCVCVENRYFLDFKALMHVPNGKINCTSIFNNGFLRIF